MKLPIYAPARRVDHRRLPVASVCAAIATAALLMSGCGQLQTATTASTTAAAIGTATAPLTATSTPVAAGTGTPVAPATATPAATTSPVAKPTLTDTGYTAPDGSPLYAECVEPGYALPPVYFTPVGTVAVPSPYDAARSTPMPTPRPGYAPDFDPLAVPPADSAAWPVEQSACAGVSFRRPPDYDVIEPFHVAGYQQEAVASYGTAGRSAVFEVSLFTTSADELGLALGSQPALGEYPFLHHAPAEIGGASGYVTYTTVRKGISPKEVAVVYFVMIRPRWYAQVTGFFTAPYDEARFATFNAFVQSFSFQP